MEKAEFQPIESVCRQFEMSPIWLHQLRIAGVVKTKCIYSINSKQQILYNVGDVEKWTEEHAEVYRDRKALGCFDRISKSSVNYYKSTYFPS